MAHPRLALIVGGHGEAAAVPILIRRVASEIDPTIAPEIVVTFRVHEDRLRKESELERYVELAARRLSGDGKLLVLLDCDWRNGCPKVDAPRFLQRARESRPQLDISVVLANLEYECWFIAASESLKGKRGLPPDLERVGDPEAIRDAKGWLRRRMSPHRPYTETGDQPALTSDMDFAEARRAPSFDKCYREIVRLLTPHD